MAQMKSLVVRTEVLEQSKVSGAKAAQELGGGSISGVPAVSAGMPLMSGPPATAFAKYTALVGPPPKVKMATPVAPVASPQVPAEAQGSEDPPGLAHALNQQSSAVLALVSHLASQSDPLSEIPGVGAHSTSIKGVQKRERMQQDLAMGSSNYYLQVMQQLIAQEVVPLSSFAEDNRRPCPPVGFDVPREDRGIQKCKRGRVNDVVARICCGRCCSRRPPSGPGEVGATHGGFGTKCGRRRLDSGISFVTSRRPTNLPFPRQNKHYVSIWKALFESGSATMGIGGSCLCERNGSTPEPETRISKKNAKSCRSRCPFSKAATSFSKEASSGSGCSKGTIDESHEEIGPVGNDVPSRLPELTGLHDGVADARNDLFGKHLSFASWCSQMVASVLRTRTAFSAFVRSAIHLSRDSSVSTSPAFPIPLPHCGVFDRMPSGLSLRQRSRIHFRRAVVITILALNFWWSGNRFIDLDLQLGSSEEVPIRLSKAYNQTRGGLYAG